MVLILSAVDFHLMLVDQDKLMDGVDNWFCCVFEKVLWYPFVTDDYLGVLILKFIEFYCFWTEFNDFVLFWKFGHLGLS